MRFANFSRGLECGDFFMIGRQYFKRQVATLLGLARSVNNPDLSASLLDKATHLKSKLDLVPADDPDRGLSAPDVQKEPASNLVSQTRRMPTAVELIVQAYVEQNDLQALESLKKHREELAARLSENKDGWFDYSVSMRQIENDLAVVEAGLAKLNSARG